MIALYCPDVPPVPGGVSDHTLILARALAALGAPVIALALRGDPARFAPIPCEVGLRPGDVAAAARRLGATSVIVQYVPFLWARRGVSPALCVGVRRMRDAGLKVAVVVHEPFVPFTRLPWLVTGIPQRLQFAWLLRHATWIYAPVPRYAALARRYGGAAPAVTLAPIGATIPVSPLSRSAARARLGLADSDIAIGVFSPAASGFLHDWIARTAKRLEGRPHVRWIQFGYGSNRVLPGYPRGPNVITVGETDEATVANTMRAIDIAAAPYADGLTMRRSGAMLALATGIATVSSTGHQFDPGLLALAACEPTAASFAERIVTLTEDSTARERLARQSMGYASTASLESLAATIARDLEGVS